MMDKLNWKGFSGVKRCLWAAGLSLGLGAGLPGCVAHARGEMVYQSPNTSYSDEYVYPTEYVTVVPARIELYPHTYYQGRTAYLVDGRWYYHNRERWVVFREEPAHLRHYRLQSAERGHAVHSDHSRYAAGQRIIEQRRAEQRRAEHRRQEHRRQEHHREQERRAERQRQEQAHERERRAEQHRQDQARRHEQRAAEHREADRRTAERRRGGRERERDRAEQERRPRQRGRRDQRDDRRDD
jgi:hypothetical protein